MESVREVPTVQVRVEVTKNPTLARKLAHWLSLRGFVLGPNGPNRIIGIDFHTETFGGPHIYMVLHIEGTKKDGESIKGKLERKLHDLGVLQQNLQILMLPEIYTANEVADEVAEDPEDLDIPSIWGEEE